VRTLVYAQVAALCQDAVGRDHVAFEQPEKNLTGNYHQNQLITVNPLMHKVVKMAT